MSLVTLDFNDSNELFVVPSDNGPQIPRASINRDAFHGEDMLSVPVPSIKLEHPEEGTIFGKLACVRVFATTMQTSVFDSDEEEYTNMSQHFVRFGDKAIDWSGGDKCGWIPSRQREKLKTEDPVAYARASKVKLYRHLFGMIQMQDAVKAGSGSVEFDPIPFRMRLGPSNFYEIGQVVAALEKQGKKHFNYNLELSYGVEKRGSNQWFVLKYKPLIEDKIDITEEDKDTLRLFEETIKKENDSVSSRMRENVSGGVVSNFIDIEHNE
jgi:hypothetical protein